MCVSRIRKTEPVQGVHLVVAEADLAAGRGVAADEGLERVRQHLAREPGHLDDLRLGRDRPGLRQPLGRLRDVHRVIADPLQIVRDLERGEEHAEVAGHRLLERQEVGAHLLDLHLHRVDDPVALDHAAGPLGVPLEQRLDRKAERRLRLARHGEQADLDVAELVVKMAMRVEGHPNLPVMYASVRSLAGRVKMRSVSPNSTSSPRSKKPVRSETRAACCMLWVTITMV